MEPVGDDLHWRLTVVPELTTPGNFLFGGCGLGAALVALEAASGRPTVWSTAQYLSYAPTDSVLDLTVTLAAEGRRVTQGRVVGTMGDKEILTVNAAVGAARLPRGRRGVGHPARGAATRPVPAPSAPRLLLHLDLRPHRRAPGPGAHLRGDHRRPERSGRSHQRTVGPGARSPRAVGGHAGHHRGLRLGRRVPAAGPAGHVPQPRQHVAGGPPGADRVGAVRHPHPGAGRRLRAGGRLPVVRERLAAGHRQPVDERAASGDRRAASRTVEPTRENR